jgi:hypothetical protein
MMWSAQKTQKQVLTSRHTVIKQANRDPEYCNLEVQSVYQYFPYRGRHRSCNERGSIATTMYRKGV